jgi:LuxR family maltose regulon positive regulatory protein
MMRSMDTRENPPRPDEPAAVVERLTGSQLRILKLLELGLSNREISDRLGITVGTTKWHVHQLFEKLQVTSRAKAVALARERGLV